MPDVFAGLHAEVLPPASPLRAAITAATLRDEADCVRDLLRELPDSPALRAQVAAQARQLIDGVRRHPAYSGGVPALMREFSLDSREGVALMCLAEALLRIPDEATAEALIRDKLVGPDWREHLGHSPSLFVNAAAWALLVTGELMAPAGEAGLGAALHRAVQRGGEPLVRRCVDVAMRLLGRHFVAGRNIEEAIVHARREAARGYRHSFDMLGEAALTAADAERYFNAYLGAIAAVGEANSGLGVRDGSGVSIKLSALHPRYGRAQRARVLSELLPRLRALAHAAAAHDIGLNIDAEEAERLELSLDLFEALALDRATRHWHGLGFVVQAYQRRAPKVIDWLDDVARRSQRRIMVRLVKGAYWDSEIRRAQIAGLASFPVFTRKPHTDLSYLACVARLLRSAEVFYPQFATHNAHSVASVIAMAHAAGVKDWEFQCLHGMGEIHDDIVSAHRCRIYAPVGPHDSLLAYLVRRLLENGANSSFVSRVVNDKLPIEALLAHPADFARQWGGVAHPRIVAPADLYQPLRANSRGLDLDCEDVLRRLARELSAYAGQGWHCAPTVGAVAMPRSVFSPGDSGDLLGQVVDATREAIEISLMRGAQAALRWAAVPDTQRAALLERVADAMQAARNELLVLLVREAGKTLPNALAEVREAEDFLRYYAALVRTSSLPGTPRGLIACISPWNFPLAIFTGQIAAALAAGNAVIAKPAEQTPLIAARMVALMHANGIDDDVLQLLPGDGSVGAAVCSDARIAGVMFTGSEAVALRIGQSLQRLPSERMLVAETGGVNAMIVDASALPEQVVRDALVSAFDSAGQRCSALRVLCLQEDIAPRVETMLREAMAELRVGDPARLSTDVGPVIDEQARAALVRHVAAMRDAGFVVTRHALPEICRTGVFFAPTLVAVKCFSDVPHEVFGPVLHVLRWPRDGLDALLDEIAASGYGLTMGVHSRIDETIAHIATRARVGNLYVNRNMIGAVVGVQPFGGEGRSGTGPKAGGPLILRRLRNALPGPVDCVGALSLLDSSWLMPGPVGEHNVMHFTPRDRAASDALGNPWPNPWPLERCMSRDLTAAGGNPALLSLADS